MTGENEIFDPVENHYTKGGVLDSILSTLRRTGKDPSRLLAADLSPVDAFHIRGRDATVDLAARGNLHPGMRVLEVGCGLGGTARYLALEHGCRVVGIDLTREYVDAAAALAELTGLGGQVEFRRASALDIPFSNEYFDVAWTEHVQMNIPDKRRFYKEIARILAPSGCLLFHDIFQGAGGAPHYPVPWAEDDSISFLISPRSAQTTLEQCGFTLTAWEDETEQSLEWVLGASERNRKSGVPALGIHLLLGGTARAKLENIVRNLRERRIAVCQAVARKA